MDQLKEFKESLVKFAAGNMTLVDEISAMQLVRLLLNCRFYSGLKLMCHSPLQLHSLSRKISQDVNKLCLQQACSKLINKLI